MEVVTDVGCEAGWIREDLTLIFGMKRAEQFRMMFLNW